MPSLYIITGSNGAGKSSLGTAYIPEPLQKEVFDGDKLLMIKKKEFWNSGIKSSKECTRRAAEFVHTTFEDLINTALHNQADFAYEGHFTNEATWDVPRRFKNSGYHIHLIFFGLTDTNISELRVITRAKEGGHYVDPPTIATNFYGNLEKLDIHFPMFDTVDIYDTSGLEHIELAKIENGSPVISIEVSDLPDWFTNNLPAITELINENL
ncbi:zeta toxin family protein [Chryseobacterium sp. PMSZPI]|uniref:zeta toxin family protein n=1 Tax=Chryseobacterium sp. PMSZPI TaxID=1033900 RepID=UPI000C34E5E0|nr:zeta toxin family protein [Chryseobacterium sp. PMSZPI]PKF73973.1 hypothetical protein CW752_11680 [Chryseobacterium sp. PMSZPI]